MTLPEALPQESPPVRRLIPYLHHPNPVLSGKVVRLSTEGPGTEALVAIIRHLQDLDEEDLILTPDGDKPSGTPMRGWLATLIRAEDLGNGHLHLWMEVSERGVALRERPEEAEQGQEPVVPLALWALLPFEDEDLTPSEDAEVMEAGKRLKAEFSRDQPALRKLATLADKASAPAPLIRAMGACLTASHQWALLREHLLQSEVGRKTNDELILRASKDAERARKEAHLKIQLKAVQEELKAVQGDGGEDDDDDEVQRKADALELSEPARKHLRKLLRRMKGLQSSSSEHAVLQAQAEVLVSLPWGKTSAEGQEPDPGLARARAALDEAHHGLVKVKRRLLQYLAVRQLTPTAPPPILCLAGPPGVGKTSLAKALAKALGRPMVRISLGGVGDESEIRGHRKTYVGSMPGRIIKAVIEAGVTDPLILLDEVDKLGKNAHRGDPAAALLEVLDPEQHSAFKDHYLEVPWDLSRAVFICTANDPSSIPAPLMDRMELIELSSYTLPEKLHIFRDHIWPSVLKDHGLAPERLTWDPAQVDDIQAALASRYTREAGVRQLRAQGAALARHVALLSAEAPEPVESWTVDWPLTEAALGPCPPLGADETCHGREPAIGRALGLAWTPAGGVVLWIEAVEKASGAYGTLTLSGKLGDVMKESATAAHSLLEHHLRRDCPSGFRSIHVHLPAGAVPKDGPSAGVGLYWVLRSLLEEVPLFQDVAMTGEITLQGRVLPVGGIKEKVLAAAAAGAVKVLLPEGNRKDWEHEVPADIKASLEVVFLSEVTDAGPHLVLAHAAQLSTIT
jgi:ATP-dependent Lon protease